MKTRAEHAPTPEQPEGDMIQVRMEAAVGWVAEHRGEFSDVDDQEVLLWAALAAAHPERREDLFAMVVKDKPHIENPLLLFDRVHEKYLATPPAEPTRDVTWESSLASISGECHAAKVFFQPSAQDLPKRLTISTLPPDGLSGDGFSVRLGDEQIIVANPENPGNVIHEYLHTFINPVVERLTGRLSPEQQRLLIAQASGALRGEYGESMSVLAEELIRTYNDWFKDGERPMTRQQFQERLRRYDEPTYQRMTDTHPKLASRLRDMGINSLAELVGRSDEYYERFERDDLRDRIYALYEGYSAQHPPLPGGFEEYLKSNSEELIAPMNR